MKRKIILNLSLSAFMLFLTSCLTFDRVKSVEDFEKTFISSLEKHIASKDYLRYLEAYDYIRRDPGPIWGNNEKIRIEHENRDTAVRNIMQIQKYKDHYILAGKYKEFVNLLIYTNSKDPDIWRDYIKSYNHIKWLSEIDFSYVGKAAKELLKDTKYETAYNEYTAYIKDMHFAKLNSRYTDLEICIVKDNLYGYLDNYNKLISEIKAADMEINFIDEKYQSYHRDCVNHFLKKVAIDNFKFKLNKKKQEYILEFHSGSRNKHPDGKYHPIISEIIVVPAMYNNLPVTEIAKDAFKDSINTKLVIIPDTIKKINDYALSDKQIAILPKDVNIADVLFEKEKLSFRLPKAIKSIGAYALSGNEFDEIHLDFDFIEKGAFSKCKFKNIIISKLPSEVLVDCNMENVVIKDSVQNIVKHAFKGCTISGNLILPNSVTTIEPLAFENSSISGNLVIPNSVTTIEPLAFENSSISGNLLIPNTVKNLESYVFKNCSIYGDLIIPNSIKTIVNNCFALCSISGNFSLPNSITTIGEKAFYNSAILNGVIVPDSVKIVEHAAFFKSKIQSIVFLNENTKFKGSYTFAGNESLKSVTLPQNIKYIPEGFFRDCSALSEIKNLPDSGTIQFGADAFAGCKSLPQAIRKKLITLGYKDGFFSID